MTKLVSIALISLIANANAQLTPQASAALDARCPCMALFTCGSVLGGDLDDLIDDDNVLTNFMTCPVGQVRCCPETEMIAALGDVLSGIFGTGNPQINAGGSNVLAARGLGASSSGAIPAIAAAQQNQQFQNRLNPDLNGRASAGTNTNQISATGSDVSNLQLFGNQEPDNGLQLTGRQGPDLASLFAGLEAGTLPGVQGDSPPPPDVSASAGVVDGVAVTSVDFGDFGGSSGNNAAAFSSFNPAPQTPQQSAFVPPSAPAAPAPVPAFVPPPLPVAPSLPVPAPVASQLPAALPVDHFSSGTQQAGPQAPSVRIIGPQPIYISNDVVSGASVDKSGRVLSTGSVHEGRSADVNVAEIRGLLEDLRKQLLGRK